MKKLNNLNKSRYHIFSDRLLMLAIIVVVLFSMIIYQFYKIQIIEHSEYAEELRATTQKQVDIPAIRGMIYDRYGKPLAINKAVYVLKVDPQAQLKKGVLDETLLKVAVLLEKNNNDYIDVIPISAKAPFVYTEDKKSCERFITNYVPYSSTEEKTEVLYKYSAEEMINYLRGEDVFNLDPKYSDEEARKIIALRLLMRQTTYQKYVQVTLAQDITMEVLAVIEENQKEYPSIFVEVESQRYYPYAKAFGNLLGYTRTITQSQYESLKDKGYETDDIVGQVGIESTQEAELRGKKGSKYIEVDNVGRTVTTEEIEAATAGNDIYLSIDAEMQQEVYEALENRLTEALVARLRGGSSKIEPLTGREILISMAKNNQLDLKEMSLQSENTAQGKLYHKIITSFQQATLELEEAEKDLPEEEKTSLSMKQHFADLLDSEEKIITDQELLLAMGEQQTLAFNESQMASIRTGHYSVENLLISLFESDLLKPDQMDITPSSGSAVVVDPHTGQTLALVSYPSYDNNEFIQDFNSVYTKLNDGIDGRNILINRALKTAKAPGSTFKMVTGIAGLEENVITTNTLINDVGVYTYAGKPEPHCWIFDNNGYGHGPINIEQALEVSCNYFFYDVAYRLGLKYGNPYGGIDILSQYAAKFGLSEKTGIELEEVSPNISNPTNLVANQTFRTLNYLVNLKDTNKEALYEEIVGHLDTGFYPSGDSKATEVEDKIDYLSRNYIKEIVDPELALVLNEDFNTIYNKLLDDFKEELEGQISNYSGQISASVMAGDTSISLKNRTKTAIFDLLKGMVQPGTRKTITKTVNKIPEDILYNAYLQGYKNTLNDCQDNKEMQDVIVPLTNRIETLEANNFDYISLTVDKVIDRIIDTYINMYLQDVNLSWNTGVNVRTGIGQGDNTFTPVQMARYMAALANGKTVYDLTVINGIKDNKVTDSYQENEPTVYGTLDIKQEYLEATYRGMHDVVSGSAGTARAYFTDMKVQVAGKTGTAQANDGESSLFVGFAPYDKPEMAIVTSMYGTDGLGSYNNLLARDVFEIFYKESQDTEKVTLGNQLLP